MRAYAGSCHCGAVRFEVDADLERDGATACTCSICVKKGFLHLIVPADRFRLLAGFDELTTYTFGTGVAQHRFCKRCGVHPFYTPRSHPDGVDVNVRCLEGVDLGAVRIDTFDGANWEANIASLRPLA